MKLDKLLSGRYFCTVLVISTYCVAIIGSLVLVVKKILEVQTFLGLFAAFTTIATMIIEGYFRREDRKKEE